jgi:hypothetical protein
MRPPIWLNMMGFANLSPRVEMTRPIPMIAACNVPMLWQAWSSIAAASEALTGELRGNEYR